MPIRAADILAQLQKYESKDGLILDAVESSRQLLGESKVVGKYSKIEVVVCDFSGIEKEQYDALVYTDSCLVILTVPIIIFNEQFLKEVEAAIRSFFMSESLLCTQYFQDDASMFGLVQRISKNPDRYLQRLRGIMEGEIEDEAAIIEELTMTIFYFLSHEIGHLLAGKDQRNYGAFLDEDAPLEHRIANAVVKMGMHMDDLAKYGFSLGDGPQKDDHFEDIKQVADDLYATVENVMVNHHKWFQDENEADRLANGIIIDYLNNLGLIDEQAADRILHRFVRGLFVAGIYSWFKDLGAFLDKLDVGRTNNSQSLMLEMLKNRERYIQAASLFGDVHRFTLLRANLSIEAVLRARCSWFEEDPATRSIWFSRDPAAPPDDFPDLQLWRQAENLQRYFMLCLLMDTAVKMSFIGYSTGWIKEIDKKRGTPQIFMMSFYSIPHELESLKKIQ